MKYYIYCLKNKKDNSIIYIGHTINPAQRLSAHKTTLFKYVDIYMEVVETIENAKRVDAKRIEYSWINNLIDSGVPLLNKIKKFQSRNYKPFGEVILVRGVSLKNKKALEKIASDNRCSVNFIMLHAIDYYLGNDTMIERELKSGYASKKIKPIKK